MATKIVTCPSCGTQNTGLENFCRNCGSNLAEPFQNQQNQQMQRPFDQNTGKIEGADKKMLVGILAIVMGVLGLNFGVHKFILGYQQEGIILLSVYLLAIILVATCFGAIIGIPMILISSVIGIFEGIMYLTKSDEEFVQTYIQNKKPWF